MKIDPEDIVVTQPEPQVKAPKRVIGWRLKDEDGYYFCDIHGLGPWYGADVSSATLYESKEEARQALAGCCEADYFRGGRVVRVVKKANYEAGYCVGKEAGLKAMALKVTEVMEKHHTGSNADTLNAIESFLQDYLK